MGQVCLEQGDYKAALRYFGEAQQFNRDNGDRRNEGYSLNYLGNVSCELGDFAQAQTYYQESLNIREQLGPRNLLCEPLAGLALVSLHMGHPDLAMMYVEQIWPHIDRANLSGGSDLLRVYLNCVRVLQATDDDRFASLLRMASELLEERSGRITNERHRQAYLEDIPTNRELRRLAEEIG